MIESGDSMIEAGDSIEAIEAGDSMIDGTLYP